MVEVFGKKTHKDSYIHADSHHYPSQKIWVLNTLSIMEERIFDKYHLEQEIYHLIRVFKSIGYREKDIKKDMKRKKGGLNQKIIKTPL
jgi:hypothetical protein